jgi:hypothetical protein
MKHSEELDLIFAAFTAAQAEMPNIIKTSDVKVQTRTGGSYTFKYVPLDEAIDTVRTIYAKHKLGVTQMVGSDIVDNIARTYINTLVVHESGQWFGDKVYIDDYLYKTIGDNRVPVSAQEAGSAITYFKRYAYVSINGLSADEDDDGNTASGNTYTKKDAPKQSAPATKPPAKPATRAPKKEETPPPTPPQDDEDDADDSPFVAPVVDGNPFAAYSDQKEVIMAYQNMINADPSNRDTIERTVKPQMMARLTELKKR